MESFRCPWDQIWSIGHLLDSLRAKMEKKIEIVRSLDLYSKPDHDFHHMKNFIFRSRLIRYSILNFPIEMCPRDILNKDGYNKHILDELNYANDLLKVNCKDYFHC